MRRMVVAALLIGGLWYTFGYSKAPKVVAGAPLPMITLSAVSEHEPPVQQEVAQPQVIQVNGYEVRTLAKFAMKARALATERYLFGREADLSPLDTAFGWGRMSDPSVIDRLNISQGNRWYTWRYDADPPIPTREIETSSANMHLIPANGDVARALSKIKKGKIIRLGGYLVEVRASDGWLWRSSLSREDTGQGACEVILVQSVDPG